MLYGSISIAVLYSIRFFYKNNKNIFDYVKLVIVLLWVLRYFVQVFHLFNFPYILEIALLLLFLWWFISDGVNYFGNRKYKIKGVYKVLYFTLVAFCLVTLLCGVLLKIQHWPYSELIFTIGILLLIILIIADYFVVNRQYKT